MANGVWTNKWGKTLITSNRRYVANKVSKGDQVSESNFEGYADVWSNEEGTIFSTNIKCENGQAWPRISEGSSEYHYDTPGYPITIDEYIRGHRCGKFLEYQGRWVDRTHGPSLGKKSKKHLQNGAYVWLDDVNENNQWPYKIEINIWNTHINDFPDGAKQFEERYLGKDGPYIVAWKDNYPFNGASFRAYYFNLENTQSSNMCVDLASLYIFLLRVHDLDRRYYIVETDIAVEGHEGGDGKFIAEIKSMGRPKECCSN